MSKYLQNLEVNDRIFAIQSIYFIKIFQQSILFM